MTAAEACDLVVALTRQLSAARAELHHVSCERDGYKLVAETWAWQSRQDAIDRRKLEDRYYRLVEELRALRSGDASRRAA